MAEAMAGRTFVKNWELEELSNLSSNGLENRNYQTGRKMFAAGGCYACHRFGNQGGMNGPDLTGSADDTHPTTYWNKSCIPVRKSMNNLSPLS